MYITRIYKRKYIDGRSNYTKVKLFSICEINILCITINQYSVFKSNNLKITTLVYIIIQYVMIMYVPI